MFDCVSLLVVVWFAVLCCFRLLCVFSFDFCLIICVCAWVCCSGFAFAVCVFVYLLFAI